MGLLGDADSQANFALAAGLLGGGNFGQAFGRGLVGYQATLNQDAERRMQETYRKAQMAQMQQQMQERQAAQARAMEQARYLQSLRAPTGTTVNAQTGITGPTPAAAAQIGQRQQPDPMELISLFGPEAAQKIMESPNWGRAEVARTIETPQGTQQVDKYGNPVSNPFARYIAPVQVNQGDKVSFVTPNAGLSLPVGMSPDQRDASARGWAGVANSRERLAFDKAGGADAGKPPAGYRKTSDGNLEAIPGGPADLKKQGMLNADTQALTGTTSSLDRLAVAANEVLNAPGLAGVYGLRGAVPNIPGSDAANAAALLNTLKSQVGFGVLQDMRNNSKTGGALGAVSDRENAMLQANIAALEASQSVDQARFNLKKIIQYVDGAKARMREAYNLKHGGNAGAVNSVNLSGGVVNFGDLK